MTHKKPALSVPTQYFHNLLKRLEALQFNPSCRVKEIAIKDVELVEGQWLDKNSISRKVRQFTSFALQRRTNQGQQKMRHENFVTYKHRKTNAALNFPLWNEFTWTLAVCTSPFVSFNEKKEGS